MKAEPDDVSIDDLARMPEQTVAWYGVRNYQARNFMRDAMKLGDLAYFYHSACAQPGIAGVVRVSRLAYPDATQFDGQHKYYDPKSDPAAPRWLSVDVTLVQILPLIPLHWLRMQPELVGMKLLSRGNRLSILPIEPSHAGYIQRTLGF